MNDISKLDYFAGQALAGLMQRENVYKTMDNAHIADRCFLIAQNMSRVSRENEIKKT